MFARKPASTAGLEAIRRETVRVALENPVGSEEFKTAMKATEKLSNLIVKEKREPLSFNVVVPAVATLLSVVIITDYEKLNVVTTKAVQFLPKLLK